MLGAITGIIASRNVLTTTFEGRSVQVPLLVFGDGNTFFEEAITPIPLITTTQNTTLYTGAVHTAQILVGSGSFTLFTDDLTQLPITVGSTSFTLFSPNITTVPLGVYGVACTMDPYYYTTSTTNPRTVLNLHFEGSLLDSSGFNAKTATVGTGVATISSSQAKFGTSSLMFNGASGTVTVPDSADFNFGSDDFTIEFWVYFNSVALANLIGKRLTSDWSNWSAVVETGTFKMRYGTTYGAWAAELISPTVPVPNRWYHFATTRSGNTFRLFIDGVVVATATISDSLFTNTAPVCIGGRSDGTIPPNGYIDELRITKGVARYTSNFTPDVFQSCNV